MAIKSHWEFLGGLLVRILSFHCQSLLGELRSRKLWGMTKKALIWPQAYPSIVPPFSGHSDWLVDKHTVWVRFEFFSRKLSTDVQRMPSSSFWGHWLGQDQVAPSLFMSNAPHVKKAHFQV